VSTVRDGGWLGLDFGTSSAKGVLLDGAGTVLARHSVAYESRYGGAGEAEQDPAAYLTTAHEIVAACGGGERVRGIGLSGQTPTLVLVDADGEPVRPALTWQDHRAHAEAEELAEALGPAEPLVGTSLPWTAGYLPAKLLWLSRHEPDNVARTRWLLQPKDFVGLRLTGSPTSDPWSSKGVCHVGTSEPADAVLGRTGWSEREAPPLAQAWHRRGEVTSGAAAAFDLCGGTPVAVGWSDAVAAMLAAGAFDGPTGFVLTGTSSIVGLSLDHAPSQGTRLLTIPATCAPLAVRYGPTESSGASVQWLARILGRDLGEVLELAASAHGDVPVFAPYIAGERAPLWQTELRGSFGGLSAEDGPETLALAVVMGVCMSEADVLAVAEEEAGSAAPQVNVAGRGTTQPPWRDARLAALGRPLRVLDEADASAFGAAMLGAAAAAGNDLDAARVLVGGAEELNPGPGAAEAAAERLVRYRAVAGTAVAASGRVAAPITNARSGHGTDR
jgi:xylulokinase